MPLPPRIQRGTLALVLVGAMAAMALIVTETGLPPAQAVTVPSAPVVASVENKYIDATSLSEVPGRLATPVEAVATSGRPLPNSAAIVAALRASDGRTVTFQHPTIVDFGHVVAGIYTRPGATADPVSDYPNFFRTKDPGETGRLTLANGDWYVARYVKLPAHTPIDMVGFRFVSGTSDAPATMAVPAGAMPGAFLASDPRLTKIWHAAASTMQLSMMTTTAGAGYQFFDGPERDREPWLWYDASADDTAYYAFGSLALPVAMDSYQAADAGSGNFGVQDPGRPDQNGFAERDLAALYNFYGDPRILSRFYSDLLAHEASVARSTQEPDGLYENSSLPLPPSPTNPAKPDDASMATEMWDYAGFLGMADLARATHDGNTATTYRNKAIQLKQAVNRSLWSESKGAFVDFAGSSHVDEAGNSMAIMYGLATHRQADRILAYLHSHNDRNYQWTETHGWGAVNPAGSSDFDRPFLPGDADLTTADWGYVWTWGMGTNPDDFSKQYNYNYALVPWAEAFEAQADFATGEDAAGIGLIDRAWGTMLQNGPSTLFEESRYDGTPGYQLGSQHNSVVHRWASGVGALLQHYVLGVAPAGSGFTTWRINPHGASLSWAQGRVPTPEGPLSVWWRWTGPPANRHSYTLVLSAPVGTSGSVELPVGRRGLIDVDGHRVWSHSSGLPGVRWSASDGRIVVPALSGGTHVISWRP